MTTLPAATGLAKDATPFRHAATALVLSLLVAGAARADERPAPPSDVPGTGCLQTIIDGRAVDFPLKHTKVEAQVSGPVARVVVTQTFQNPYAETIEATYVFPLPHEAAVSDFHLRVGERDIRGIIEKRDEARRIYEAARDAGHVASLLEQERPNIFTQSVANIVPGHEIDVAITYVETLNYEDGAWEVVFPTVVGPRFIPPGSIGNPLLPAGFAQRPAPSVPDADKINPSFLPPGLRSAHDLSIRVNWDAGVPIDVVESPTHRVDVKRIGDRRAEIALHPIDSVPNKDFVLRLRAKGERAETGVLSYHDGKDGYLTVLLHPKLDLEERDLTSREMIFVLDSSGSMSGEPIAAAKSVIRRALLNMNPDDTFQMINFSSTASSLGPAPVPATPENVKRGLAYLDRLEGEGGTMMIEGIRAALDFPHDPHRLRMVMFLTDGYIGNEQEIFAAVRQKIGDARLFSFGVGSSVNRYLLDGLAEEGRGETQYVLPGSSAMEAADRFEERVRHPYLTDVELVWNGVRVEEATPARVPDLFGGTPLAVHARYEHARNASLEVRGKLAGRPWRQRVPLDLPRRKSGNEAVGALWARARIADLGRDAHTGMTSAIEDEITRLGLAHRLVTQFTSFVAVEEKTIVSDGRPQRVQVPVEMPQGVSWEGVFGEEERASVMNSVAPGGGFLGSGGFDMSKRSVRSAAPESKRGDRAIVQEAPAPAAIERTQTKDAGPLFVDGRAVVVLRLSATPNAVKAGESITLTLTLVNQGGYAVEVPKSFRWDDARLRLRVVDAQGRISTLSTSENPSGKKGATLSLAPGKTHTIKARLSAAEAAILTRPGRYEIVLLGEGLGMGDSNAVTIEVLR